MKAFALPCLILLLSGCVVFGEDGENTPGSLSDPADTSDAADASDETDTSDSADTSDPSNTEPECSEQTPCSDGLYCAEGECVPKESNGGACTEEAMCASGFCVDGVCCESACDATCQTCSALVEFQSTGECRAYESGIDPENECSPQMCDGEGACFAGEAGTACIEDYECGGALVCNQNICSENICGDGQVRGTEECDDANNSNFDGCLNTCESARCGDGFTLQDIEECDDTGESETCNSDCTISECGDGKTNTSAGEFCDTEGESAECDIDCTLSECGDSTMNISAGEACEPPEAAVVDCDYGLTSCEICNESCQLFDGATRYCGDDIIDINNGEECDHNGIVTTNCEYGQQSCTLCNINCIEFSGDTRFCGDGSRDEEFGELCDDGNTLLEACNYGDQACIVCNSSCQEVVGETSYCGDGNTDLEYETCDDGNAITETCEYGETSCTVCDETCQEVPGVTSYCGDNVIDTTNNENCDHAGEIDLNCAYSFNQENASCQVCNTQCVLQPGQEHYCGDNVTDASEQCDTEGDSDQCDSDCTLVSCGDAYTNFTAGEECDHAGDFNLHCDYAFNEISCIKCNASCREVPGITHFCGDGTIDTEQGEECDEGSYSTSSGTDLFYGCPGCASTVCTGDFIVTSSSSNAIDDCNVIDGDLTIQAFQMDCTICAFANYDFEQIYKVTGTLEVIPLSPDGLGWTDDLRKLNLDNLRAIGQNLSVTRYEFCIGIDCTYHENQQLLELSLQRLEQVSNAFIIDHNPLLNKFWVPALSQVGSLDITYNPALCLDEDTFGRDPWGISFSGPRTINNNKSTGCD